MASLLKKAIFDLARASGYTIIPNRRLRKYAQARYLDHLLAHLKVDCVFDVGANVGWYRDFLRNDVGYTGRIVSFEPIPEHVELLRNRAKNDAAWLVEGYALGNASGTATFNVMKDSEFSSFLEPDHSATSRFDNSNIVHRQIDVEIKTLETVIPQLQRRLGFAALYLKLDTQGYDLEVARGAGAAIRAVCGLQTEASVTPIYAGMPDYCTTIRTFQSLGFELSGLYPNNPQHFPKLHEFDCHMVRGTTTQSSVSGSLPSGHDLFTDAPRGD